MSDVIGCHEAVRRLWRFLDGALDATDEAQVEQHLAFCRRCCGEMEFAQELQAMLHTTSAHMPADAKHRLEDLIGSLDVDDDLDDDRTGEGLHDHR